MAALEGKEFDLSKDDLEVPPEIDTLLSAAAGDTPASSGISGSGDDWSLLLLGRFFNSEDGGCAFTDELPPRPQIQAAAALLEGVCLERRGELTAALGRYEEAVSLAPWNRVARLDRVLLLARMGRYAAARVELSHLSDDAPGHPILRVLEGLLAGVDGDKAALELARAELLEIAPAYSAWMDEVLAE